ncbi:MAG TPA: xanthine dehydrogenase family protein molybdopterin-binding subunit [Verrucomicrobiae bacterium]|jgi:CO/xanthine dehydrogenase Mo-binding subunit|nr:xanthine dehydrogenase family protein molybdopterin-binding subunit [Verrucomicrobiae bacterium]
MSLIGKSEPRHDALGKVTGAAKYPADLVKDDMVKLKVVFANRPHAKILSIDASAALAHPGVVAVFTAADVPYNRFGLVEADQPLLCDGKVRFWGDRAALVAAETAEAAEEGANLVRVEYEDLPPVLDALTAAASATLVHEDRESNLLGHVCIRKGDVDAAFGQCDVVLEGDFETGWQEHAYLQPDAGIAYYEGDNLVVETAGQWLHEDVRQLAAMFELPEERMIVRYATIGGAFGGREDLNVTPLLALATFKLKRPSAMVWSRDESIIAHHKRHPYFIHGKWGARKDGKILAAQTTLTADGGAYASTSVEVLKGATLFASGCYDVDNVASDGYVVYTNNIPCGAFRGFGAPQAHFAAETMVTRLAHALDLDPFEIRRRNMYREGSIEPTNHPLPQGVGAIPTLERCAQEAGARLGYGLPDASVGVSQGGAHLKRGVGIASGIKNVGYSFGFPDQATATVELFGSKEIERAVLRIGAADVGQGSHLILRQICAETLGCAMERVEIVADDSIESPNAGSASASRMTYMGGRAVFDAATAARAKFPGDGHVVATQQFRPTPTTPIDPLTHAGTPNFCYGYVSQAVEVEVDTRTGQVRILRIVSVHDVGKAINKQQVEGQIEGCLAQAVGYVLTENMICRDGKILTPYFSTYLLPTTLDMPTEVFPIILEGADPHGPYGARGMAEMPLVPFAAAVAGAIHAATGAWITQLPMTPERVLRALREGAGGRWRA